MKTIYKKLFIFILCFLVINVLNIIKVKATEEDEELRRMLLEEGWTEEEIEAVLSSNNDNEDANDNSNEDEDEDEYEDEEDDEEDEEDEDVDYNSNEDKETDDEKMNYKEDDTKSTKELVYAGLNHYYVLFIFSVGLIIFFFMKYMEYKNIK